MNNRWSCLIGGAALLVSGSAALAQQTDDEIEEVVVVGTRGEPRSALDSPVPVEVIGADEIRSVSALGGELGELLLAVSPSFNFPRQSNSGSADHIRAAQLRGMSPDQVLVLVNGKRQHTAAVVNLESKIGLGTTPFDFNTIPLVAIERVEILRDGAGAQYGSDAIAGVINIVLKDQPEGGAVSLHYGAHHTDFKPTGETKTDGQTVAVAGDYGVSVADNGTLRFGAEYRRRSSTTRGGIGALPFFEEFTPRNLAFDPALVFAPGDGDSEDIYLFYNLSLPLTTTGEFYSFGRFSDRDAEGTAFFRYPDGFTGVPSVYPNGYRPTTTGDSQDFSFTTGLKGAASWSDWDLSFTVGQNDYDFGVVDSINPSFGAASPLEFDLAGFEFTQYTLNADLVRRIETASLAGAATLAYGAELRFEDYQTRAGDPESYLAGPFADFAAVGAQAGPGLAADSVVDVDRTVVSAYLDFSVPVTEDLLVGLAARYEDYDDFGDALTGKLSGIYHLSDTFALRAAAGTSFRAPSLAQTGFEFSTTNFGEGGMLTVFGHLPVSDPLAIANGARELTEEESTSFSAGFVVDGRAFDLTVDVFHIDVDDRITLTFGSMDDVTFFANLVDTETEGIDIAASGTTPWGAATVNWRVAYNYSDTDVKNPQVIGEEEVNTLETAAPDDKIILSANWARDRWNVLGRLTRFGETTRDFDFGGGFPDPQTYGSKWSLDLELGYDITDGWSVAIGGENVLDEYPELSDENINFFGHLPYDVLSPIGMNGAYFYVTTRYSLD